MSIKKNPIARIGLFYGAGDRGRTDTVSLPLDFESSTSANSITPAYNRCIVSQLYRKIKSFLNIFLFLKDKILTYRRKRGKIYIYDF